MAKLEVCFSPALFSTYDTEGKIIVLVDILRATSTICAALHHGVKEIIPVTGTEEARAYKEKGFMVAGERDGQVLDFADFGNSPFNFLNDEVIGRSIAYSTTNGTKAISAASGCEKLVVGAYLNHAILAEWLISQNKDVIIYCAGWKNKFNLEDSLYAGALSETLLETGVFETICDSTVASVDLWLMAKSDVLSYIQKAAHRDRLRKLGLDDVLEYCHTFNKAPVIPLLVNQSLVVL